MEQQPNTNEEQTNEKRNKTDDVVSSLEKISFGVFVGVILGFIFGTKIIDVFSLNSEDVFGWAIWCVTIVFLVTIIGFFRWKTSFKPFLGLLAGLVTGSMLIELLTSYFVTKLELIGLFFVILVIFLLGSGYFIYVYKKQLLEIAFGTSKIKTKEIGGTFFEIIKAGFSRDFEKASGLTNTIFQQISGSLAWLGYTRFLFLLLQTMFLIFGGLIGSLLLYKQNELLTTQNRFVEQQTELIKKQNRRLDQQTHLQEAERRSSLVFLFSNIMDAIDRELREDLNEKGKRDLSPQLIGRITALSKRLKPYRYLEGDSLIKIPLSPERGQLITSLIGSKLDTITLGEIIPNLKLDKSELIRVNFRGAKLGRANLYQANLSGAHFIAADLSAADLSGTNLSHAKLMSADLSHANLVVANLSRADLRDAKLNRAKLMSADLSHAKLINAALIDANLMTTKLIGADLRNADLTDAKLINADLSGTNLTGANLSGAMLSGVNLIGADLSGVKLSGVSCDSLNINRLFSDKIISKTYTYQKQKYNYVIQKNK